MKYPKVWIIILNYNGADDTLQCIESLYKLDYDNFYVIVLDNHSKDNSEDIIKAYQSAHPEYPFVFKQTGKNGGYAAGNNIGIRYALQFPDTAYVWILNNDTLVTSDSLKLMINKVEADPTIGICGSKLIYSWDKSRVQAYGGAYNPVTGISYHILDPKHLDKLYYVVGASALVSREFLEKIGLMCEDYFLYYEETDWAARAKGKFKMACAENAVIYHKEGASIGVNHNKNKKKSSDLSFYYSIRNRLLFTRKFYPFYYPLTWTRMIYTFFHNLVQGEFKRCWMILNLMFNHKIRQFENIREI